MWIPTNQVIVRNYPHGILKKDVSSAMGTLTKGTIVYIVEIKDDWNHINVMDMYGHTITMCDCTCVDWLDDDDERIAIIEKSS